MKKNLRLFTAIMLGSLFAPVFFVPVSLAAVMTEPEAQIALDCKKNITLPDGLLSPGDAAGCVEKFNAADGDLMEKFKTDFPALAVEVLSKNNALVDLQTMISKYRGIDLARSLLRVIENPDCVPCKMGLGPEPEKLSVWVKDFIPARELNYNWSVRRWDAMGDKRIAALSGTAYAQTPGSWGALKLMPRYEKLYEIAKKDTDNLLAASAMAGAAKTAAPDYTETVVALKEDLLPFRDWTRVRKLDDFLTGTAAKAAEPAPSGPSSADKKSADLAKASASLAASQGAGGARGYLDQSFDNTAAGAGEGVALSGRGSGKKDFKGVAISKSQGKELAAKLAAVKDGKMQGYLAAELKGTKAGDEIISFYENPAYAKKGTNKLDFGFTKGKGPLKGAIGWWSGSEKVLKINSDVVDEYTKERGITPAQLLKDEKLLKDFSAYIAPVFVHEGTHQRQTAWTKEKGLDYYKNGKKSWAPYQMEMETEAFSMNAAFVAEKTKAGGTAYLKKLSWWDRADAEKYLEDGVEGLRTQKHTYDYYAANTDTIPGSAAKELQAATYSAQMVQYLENKARTTPDKMTRSDQAKLKEHKGILDTRFSWYRQILQKSKDDERKLLEWRKQINSGGVVSGILEDFRMAPPEGEE